MARTQRQLRGTRAEALVADRLRSAGWSIVATNVRIGRDEVDLVAVDPGPPAELVAVEVRSASSSAFGAPEERVNRAKVDRLYRALAAMGTYAADRKPSYGGLPRRVDLVVVDRRGGRLAIRHMSRLERPV